MRKARGIPSEHSEWVESGRKRVGGGLKNTQSAISEARSSEDLGQDECLCSLQDFQKWLESLRVKIDAFNFPIEFLS